MQLDAAEAKGLLVILAIATVATMAIYMLVFGELEQDCLRSMVDSTVCYDGSLQTQAGRQAISYGVTPALFVYVSSLVIYRGVRQ